MKFKYSSNNGKVYTFKDLDEGETFMLFNPRKNTTVFEVCSVYMVVEDKAHAIDLGNGHLLFIDSDQEVYPVICECSVSLYSDV